METPIQQMLSIGSGLIIGIALSLTIWILNFLKSSKFDLVASSAVASVFIFLSSVQHILGVGITHVSINDIIRIGITTILGAFMTGFFVLPSVGKQLFNFDFQRGWYNDEQITTIIRYSLLNPRKLRDSYAQLAWPKFRALASSRGIKNVHKLRKEQILLELLIKDLSQEDE